MSSNPLCNENSMHWLNVEDPWGRSFYTANEYLKKYLRCYWKRLLGKVIQFSFCFHSLFQGSNYVFKGSLTQAFQLQAFFMNLFPPMLRVQRKFHLWIPFWELSRISPNFHIFFHVSVSSWYIPRIGPHISCSRIGRSTVGRYKSLTETWMWKLGLWQHNSFSGYPIRTVSNIFEKFAEINLIAGVLFTGDNCSLVSMTPAINLSPVSMTTAMTENPWQGLTLDQF